jgi:hypothetical protein
MLLLFILLYKIIDSNDILIKNYRCLMIRSPLASALKLTALSSPRRRRWSHRLCSSLTMKRRRAHGGRSEAAYPTNAPASTPVVVPVPVPALVDAPVPAATSAPTSSSASAPTPVPPSAAPEA